MLNYLWLLLSPVCLPVFLYHLDLFMAVEMELNRWEQRAIRESRIPLHKAGMLIGGTSFWGHSTQTCLQNSLETFVLNVLSSPRNMLAHYMLL